MTTETDTPSSSKWPKLLCNEAMVGGQRSGARIAAGWRSKVASTQGRPSARARLTAWRITSWWPRCTPSNVPMHTTDSRHSGSSRSTPKWTCILLNCTDAPLPLRKGQHKRERGHLSQEASQQQTPATPHGGDLPLGPDALHGDGRG